MLSTSYLNPPFPFPIKYKQKSYVKATGLVSGAVSPLLTCVGKNTRIGSDDEEVEWKVS